MNFMGAQKGVIICPRKEENRHCLRFSIGSLLKNHDGLRGRSFFQQVMERSDIAC
jgi:hypothetical protein